MEPKPPSTTAAVPTPSFARPRCDSLHALFTLQVILAGLMVVMHLLTGEFFVAVVWLGTAAANVVQLRFHHRAMRLERDANLQLESLRRDGTARR
jgi:hypothetical protein